MSSVAPTPVNDLTELNVFGPVTRQRLRRLGFAYLSIFVVGMGLALFAGSVGLQSFGLGLAFPGADFCITQQVVMRKS